MAYYNSNYYKRSQRNGLNHRKPWVAIVHWNGRRHFLGCFSTQEEAERRECLELDRYLYEELYAADPDT